MIVRASPPVFIRQVQHSAAFRQIRRTVWLLLLAIAAFTSGCAHTDYSATYILGRSLCPEGPPAWTASDGRRIMVRTWGPIIGQTRAIVIAVPGWNATAGDIEPLARYLAPRGIRIYSSGIRGQHGDLTARASHTQGDITDGRLWTRDFCEFTAWVRSRYPRTPFFFYGESMGALIVLTAIDAAPPGHGGQPRGIILHSPAVAMMYAAPPTRSFTSFMRALYGDRLLFNIGLISGEKPTLTSDTAFDRIWAESSDRVSPGFTWRFFDEALKLGLRARAAAARLRLPVLVLTGDKDPIGTAGVGQHAFTALMNSIPSPSKQRIRFPDGYHDLLHDKNKPRALQSIATWIDSLL